MKTSGDWNGGTIIAQHTPTIATTTRRAASGRGTAGRRLEDFGVAR